MSFSTVLKELNGKSVYITCASGSRLCGEVVDFTNSILIMNCPDRSGFTRVYVNPEFISSVAVKDE